MGILIWLQNLPPGGHVPGGPLDDPIRVRPRSEVGTSKYVRFGSCKSKERWTKKRAYTEGRRLSAQIPEEALILQGEVQRQHR